MWHQQTVSAQPNFHTLSHSHKRTPPKQVHHVYCSQCRTMRGDSSLAEKCHSVCRRIFRPTDVVHCRRCRDSKQLFACCILRNLSPIVSQVWTETTRLGDRKSTLYATNWGGTLRHSRLAALCFKEQRVFPHCLAAVNKLPKSWFGSVGFVFPPKRDRFTSGDFLSVRS